MSDLISDLEAQKKKYREIFVQTLSEIDSYISELSPEGFEGSILVEYQENSLGKYWQEKVINALKQRLLDIKSRLTKEILSLRKSSKCICCGTCCRFACSEFSCSELLNKAKNGDKTANDFLSIFSPYENIDEVKQIFPEYVELLEKTGENGYYFYHCSKVTKDNKCSDYENRPQICRDFPDNPTVFLPLKCGFNDWKLKSNSVSLKLSAEMEISLFYIEKIEGLYK